MARRLGVDPAGGVAGGLLIPKVAHVEGNAMGLSLAMLR
jgi:hypothetical protein